MSLASSDPSLLPAHQLSVEMVSGRLSPRTVVDALLGRIAAQEDKLHAFVEVYADDARLAAEAAEKAIRAGHRVGPLHGVPIALKDLIEIEGRVTTGGSQVWRDRRSAYTATVVKRLLGAGMIVLGKTHTVEFAMGGWGTNQHRGTPWNPWDPAVARTPGAGRAAAPASRSRPAWGPGGLAPIPAVRSGCPLPGAG
jgi:aspartyl-tRNA(Asn)/glutamyl-tRNA(Gln) amidotransferase subunit A